MGGQPRGDCPYINILTRRGNPPVVAHVQTEKNIKKTKKCMVNDYGKYREQLWI